MNSTHSQVIPRQLLIDQWFIYQPTALLGITYSAHQVVLYGDTTNFACSIIDGYLDNTPVTLDTLASDRMVIADPLQRRCPDCLRYDPLIAYQPLRLLGEDDDDDDGFDPT